MEHCIPGRDAHKRWLLPSMWIHGARLHPVGVAYMRIAIQGLGAANVSRSGNRQEKVDYEYSCEHDLACSAHCNERRLRVQSTCAHFVKLLRTEAVWASCYFKRLILVASGHHSTCIRTLDGAVTLCIDPLLVYKSQQILFAGIICM